MKGVKDTGKSKGEVGRELPWKINKQGDGKQTLEKQKTDKKQMVVSK